MPSRAEELFKRIQAEQLNQIAKLIADQQQETEYLDYKGGTMEEGTRLKHWAAALSAYANTEGGVLVWGIDGRTPRGHSSHSEAISDKPCPDPDAVAGYLRDRHLSITTPPVAGVEIITVKKPSGEGYVVCYIPRGESQPYRDTEAGKYWMRIQRNNVLIPHDHLRQMFYPRTSPLITFVAHWEEHRIFRVQFVNDGTASATDIYATRQLFRGDVHSSTSHGRTPGILHPQLYGEIGNFKYQPHAEPVKFLFECFMRDQQPQASFLEIPAMFDGPYTGSNGLTVRRVQWTNNLKVENHY